MATISNNQAAWVSGKGEPFEVSQGPDQSSPAEDEVIIKVSYAAINPVDWKIQTYGFFVQNWPVILGSDVSGEVAAVGSKVTHFSVGDRVMAHALGLSYGGSRHGGFQTFVAARERVVSKIPSTLELSQAVVLPLAISTAASGLYEHLHLALPEVGGAKEGKGTLLVWGASSSVGTVAMQLARAAGYEVVATASEKNFAYARELGANEVFDYRDGEVIGKILEYLKGKKFVGVFDAVSEASSMKASVEILEKTGGGNLAVTLTPPENLPNNITAGTTYGTNPGTVDNYVAAKVWSEFVPAALSSGQFQAKPDPIIVEGGLKAVEEAARMQQKGVSAAKVVVKIA